MTQNPNVTIKDRFVAAVMSGDQDTLKALCDPDFELHEGSSMPFAGVYRGADGFLRFLGVFFETLDIERLESIRTYTTDDPSFIANEFEVRGTLRANGKIFDSSMVEIWQFRNGQVLSIKAHYFNSALAS
jgi:ketosteroid isomerase-like protein